MYTAIGVLQRDAPSKGNLPEFQTTQRQLANDLAQAIKDFNLILSTEISEYFKGYDPNGWPSTEQIVRVLQEQSQSLEQNIQTQRDKLDRLQQLFDEAVS